MSHPEPYGEQPAPEPEQAPGLIDPRSIHPAPEGIFIDGAASTDDEPAPMPSDEESPPEEDVRGMADPRREAAGPDL